VNLDSVGTSFDACFLNFITLTWQSQSPHAALADLVIGGLPSVTAAVTVANDTVCAGSTAVFTAVVTGGLSSLTYSWNGGSFSSVNTYTISPATTSGTVSVTIQGTGGCTSASTTANLVVNPAPTVNPVACGGSVCSGAAGSAISFSGTAGATFTWTSTTDIGFGTSGTGNISTYTGLAGSTVTTTTVTVTPSIGTCIGTPENFVVTAYPSPTVTATDASVCMGSTVSLSGTPSGGTWAGYGVSGSSFDATTLSAGVYTVNYYMINTYGCVGATNISVTVNDCSCAGKNSVTGIMGNEYNIAPNPSEGAFTLNMPAVASEAQVVITDVQGRILEKRTITKNENSQQLLFSLAHQNPGVYYIQINNGGSHFTNKVLLQ
jgi:hypothetical protein